MKVLHAPVNVGNQAWAVRCGERALGLDSRLIMNYGTWLGYPADKIIGEYGQKDQKTVLRRIFYGCGAPLYFDVLHFYFGRTLMCWDDYGARNSWWYSDLRLAKKLGRKTVMTLQGCDARLSDLSASANAYTPCDEGRCSAVQYCRNTYDAEKRFLIKEVLPLVDRAFYLNPELGKYVPEGSFLPYATAGLEQMEPAWPATEGKIKILHAPSDETVKGSTLIYAAIAELEKLYDLEFIKVTGLPHVDAMRLYREADLVIDQVLAGWYGGFAVEVMGMGKPVVCYIRDNDLEFIPKQMRDELPIIRCEPSSLAKNLSEAIERRQQWPELGRRSRRYALRWHSPRNIASGLKRVYGNITAPLVIGN